MTDEIKVGDTVYIKDSFVEKCKRSLMSLSWQKQVAKSSGRPFVVVDIYNVDLPPNCPPYFLTPLEGQFDADFNSSTSTWKGWPVKHIPFFLEEIEKREGNQISLYELNKDLK